LDTSHLGRRGWNVLYLSPTVSIAEDHPLFGVSLRLPVRGIVPTAGIVEADSFIAFVKIETGRTR